MKELSSRPRSTILELLELFASMLRPEVVALLDRLEAELVRSPASIGMSGARDCCLESLKALRLRREESLPAMFEALQRGCAETLASARQPWKPAMAAAPQATTSLRLLDDEAMDEEGTLAAIASRHEHRASLALLLLGQRFGVLLGSPPLAAHQLPVGPHALGQAMASAARRIGLCLDARMALYRLHDMQLMNRYPGFVEAMDAHVDRAGILPGLAFVPLRPASAAPHGGRGRAAEGAEGAEGADQSAAESRAAKVVNEALGMLRQTGRLPESMAEQRNMVISAMARFLLRHGQDSSEWQDCVRYARAVLEAARRREPPSAEVRAWIGNALRSVGYSGDDAHKLASALTSIAILQEPVTRKADGMRSAREQRCLERLAALPLGTRLGFSTGGGFMRSRLRYHYVEPGLLLLANEVDGQEALFEIDAVARQMAAGQAWVIRHSPAASVHDVASDHDHGGAAGRQWPQHVRGRELS
jgi:hypothetical protein